MLVKCHLCRDCGKQDARTLNGYNYCYECNEYHNAKMREYRARNREQINEKRHNLYVQYRNEHRCGLCGKQIALYDNHSMCPICRGVKKQYFVKTYEHKRVGNICFQCCKMPPIQDKKLCQSCYDKAVERCRLMREKKRVNTWEP